MNNPIADLYVCWHCNDHHVSVEAGADPPAYHDCGYGPLQWSGHLHAYEPETGKILRTWDEKPPAITQIRIRPEPITTSDQTLHRGATMRMRTRERIELAQIVDNPWQPRLSIDEQSAEEMADSISQLGLLQAPLGRRTPGDPEQIQLAHGHRRIAGVRRLRGRVEWTSHVDMDLQDLTDEEMALIALAENQQRRQLTQIEVLRAQKRAVDETELTVQALAEQLKIGRSTLSNNLRVLELPDFVLEHVEAGALTVGAAKEILVLQNDGHCHTDDMRAVISAIANTYRVVHQGEPPNFSRKNVRLAIHRRVAGNEQDFRPIGKREAGMGGLNGASRETTFDIEAFAQERPDTLHTIPDDDKSRVWTCDVKEWRRRQTQASREANKQAEVSGTDRNAGRAQAPSRDKQFEQALAKDPVFKKIVAGREKKGPNRPVTEEEKAALGTRAELQSVDRHGNEFWKILENAQPGLVYDWERNQTGGRVPPFFKMGAADCRYCIAGAAYAKEKFDYVGTGVNLVCTNQTCYDKKLAGDEASYREQVEAELTAANSEDDRVVRGIMVRLAALSHQDLRTLASSLISAQPQMELLHFLGVPHKKWSYKPVTVKYVTGMLNHTPALFDHLGRGEMGKATLDIATLGEVPDDDLLELAASLMTYHLRQADQLDTVPQGTQLEIPQDAYEPVGA